MLLLRPDLSWPALSLDCQLSITLSERYFIHRLPKTTTLVPTPSGPFSIAQKLPILLIPIHRVFLVSQLLLSSRLVLSSQPARSSCFCSFLWPCTPTTRILGNNNVEASVEAPSTDLCTINQRYAIIRQRLARPKLLSSLSLPTSCLLRISYHIITTTLHLNSNSPNRFFG